MRSFLASILQKQRAFWLRRRLHGRAKQASLICINCIGGVVSHDFGLPFRSPTVNLRFLRDDFLCFAANLRAFLQADLTELGDPAYDYPSGLLACEHGTVRVYFQHYHSFEEAKAAWQRRCARVDFDNLVLMVEGQDASRDMLEAYEALPYARKVFLCENDQPGLPHCFHLHVYNRPDYIPGMALRRKPGSLRRWYEEFDVTAFLNDGTIQKNKRWKE
ncbi:MAG: DUF1919 domain-containing protein [Oscillospiraceae bacterium]|jgi:uncharacterized protein (DUF1919 family)|nr:DUF1919 domain-containing protein [Oscillospiraceae bacterium]